MLKSISHILGFKIEAIDGNIGKVKDFYFDDQYWIIRYLVADTDGLLKHKEVLISPAAFNGGPKWDEKHFSILLTKDKIRNSPPTYTDLPVSRQKEIELSNYYNWPNYWATSPGSGFAPYFPVREVPFKPPMPSPEERNEDVHLRSSREIFSYRIHAKDGEIGQVEDFLIDDAWIIQFLVVDTTKWLPGKKVLIFRESITDISWENSEVRVNLTKEEVKESLEYHSVETLDSGYEEKLYHHYRSH